MNIINRTFAVIYLALGAVAVSAQEPPTLIWSQLPDIPDELGVAGPFVGVHDDVLVVAGGANFPRPVWESNKVWREAIYVCERKRGGYQWSNAGSLNAPIAYGAAVSTQNGIICIGGNDGTSTFRKVFRLEWRPDSHSIHQSTMPSLPVPCVYGQAILIDDVIYLAGGQTGAELSSATNQFWKLDLRKEGHDAFQWEALPPFPGSARAFNIVTSQHNGEERCVYVMSGRAQTSTGTEFLTDVYEFSPGKGLWCGRRKMPECRMAGIGFPIGDHEILVAGGADGTLFSKSDELRDTHPGFPTGSLVYNAKTNTWKDGPPVPKNHVTTIPVQWGDSTIIASGEIRPRVRSPKVWSISTR